MVYRIHHFLYWPDACLSVNSPYLKNIFKKFFFIVQLAAVCNWTIFFPFIRKLSNLIFFSTAWHRVSILSTLDLRFSTAFQIALFPIRTPSTWSFVNLHPNFARVDPLASHVLMPCLCKSFFQTLVRHRSPLVRWPWLWSNSAFQPLSCCDSYAKFLSVFCASSSLLQSLRCDHHKQAPFCFFHRLVCRSFGHNHSGLARVAHAIQVHINPVRVYATAHKQ